MLHQPQLTATMFPPPRVDGTGVGNMPQFRRALSGTSTAACTMSKICEGLSGITQIIRDEEIKVTRNVQDISSEIELKSY